MIGESWPLFMLRDFVLLPGAEQTLFFGRPSTVATLERALGLPRSQWPKSGNSGAIPLRPDAPVLLLPGRNFKNFSTDDSLAQMSACLWLKC